VRKAALPALPHLSVPHLFGCGSLAPRRPSNLAGLRPAGCAKSRGPMPATSAKGIRLVPGMLTAGAANSRSASSS
jgi:hypothetical protein